MTSSVTGPDRRPTTDTGRRTGARPGEGAEAFGSALSAELDHGPADQAQRADRHRQSQASQATQSRTAQQRAQGVVRLGVPHEHPAQQGPRVLGGDDLLVHPAGGVRVDDLDWSRGLVLKTGHAREPPSLKRNVLGLDLIRHGSV